MPSHAFLMPCTPHAMHSTCHAFHMPSTLHAMHSTCTLSTCLHAQTPAPTDLRGCPEIADGQRVYVIQPAQGPQGTTAGRAPYENTHPKRVKHLDSRCVRTCLSWLGCVHCFPLLQGASAQGMAYTTAWMLNRATQLWLIPVESTRVSKTSVVRLISANRVSVWHGTY